MLSGRVNVHLDGDGLRPKPPPPLLARARDIDVGDGQPARLLGDVGAAKGHARCLGGRR